jgi:hypothetical protein
MITGDEIESMAKRCPLNPRTCGNLGSIVPHMTTLCLKEWVKGDSYHPFCYKMDNVRL